MEMKTRGWAACTLVCMCLAAVDVSAAAFGTGSLIIPMDVGDPAAPPADDTTDPQYQNHGYLRAHGLVFQLLQAGIPVHWAISTDKVTDFGLVDFSASVDTNAGPGSGSGTLRSYRGGPFIVDAANADAARAILTAFNTGCSDNAAPYCVNVHEARGTFTAPVYKTLTAAPSFSILRNGSETIAFRYLNAAGITSANNQTWPTTTCGGGSDPCATFPEVAQENAVAGCPGAATPGACTAAPTTGTLFDAYGDPAYCAVALPHYTDDGWSALVGDALKAYLLNQPTHATFGCTATTTFENLLQDNNRRMMTTEGISGQSSLLGALTTDHNNVGFAQAAVEFEGDSTHTPAAWIPSNGGSYHGSSLIHTFYKLVIVGDPVLRDVWGSGRAFGDTANGRVSMLGGHDYCAGDACVGPILARNLTQGVRYFLNGLLESPCTSLEGQPLITLTLSAPSISGANRVTYAVNADNSPSGKASAQQVVITLQLPAGAAFVSASGGGTYNAGSNTVTWSLVNRPVGSSDMFTVEVDLVDGSYSASVSYQHVVGRTTLSLTDTADTIVDTGPPVVDILSGPSNPTRSTSATFLFAAQEPVVEYQCRLGSGVFTPCTSPMTYSSLAEGSYTFEVRALDLAGNLGDATSYPWTIDLTGPNTTITDAPSSPSRLSAPSFSFEADETGASFECRLDSGSFLPCSSPHVVSVGDGAHTLQVRALDGLGNIGPVAFHNWLVDLAAPETTFIITPGSPTSSTTADFTFESSEANSTFQCRLDNDAFAACTSPGNLTGLTHGTHTYRVFATDEAGNADSTPATHTWTVDLVGPDTLLTSPTQGSTTRQTQPSITGETEAGATVTILVDGNTVATRTADGSGNFSYALSAAQALGQGPHTASASATDSVGNVGALTSVDFTVDVTGPTVTLTDAPSSPSRFASGSFSFEADDPAASFECRLDNGSFGPCTSPYGYVNLTDGSHTFRVRATDPYGNVGATVVHTWMVDLVAPQTSFTLTPASPTADTTAELAFQANEPNCAFQCRLDDDAFAPCTSPVNLTGLTHGTHTFRVFATDEAGNVDATPAVHTWVVDLQAPGAPSILSPTEGSATRDTQPVITGRAEAGAEVTIVVDGVEVGTATADAQGNFSYALPQPLSEGTHTVSAYATDAVGNVGASSPEVSFTVDLSAPDTSPPDTVVDSGPSAATNSTVASFTFHATETGSTFECQLDTAPFTSCSGPGSQFYSGISDGQHTFSVRATDGAGNTDPTPATWTWTVDTQAPGNPTITNPATGSSVATTNPTIRGTAEPGAHVTLTVDGNVVAVVTADENGEYSYTLTGPQTLSQGLHVVGATATDAAGNSSGTTQSAFTVDTVPPDPPVITTPADNTVTSERTPTISGVAEAGSRVEIFVDGTLLATVTAGADGRYSYTPGTGEELVSGDHTISVTATDGAGNTSAPSTVDITVDPNAADTTPPETLIFQAPDALTSSTDATFGFTSSENNSTFTCTLDGTPLGNCQSPLSLNGLSDGEHVFQVTATDAAGNIDASPAMHRWIIDSTAPDAPVITSPTNGSSTADDTPVVRGTAEPGSTVSVLVDGQVVATVIVAADGTFTTTLTTLSDGEHTVTAVATDPAGNTSDPSPDVVITIVDELCGDGIISGTETCDDANPAAGDGCSASCQVEDGYVCTGEPSLCSQVDCGNGIITADEGCDDGNELSGDGCSNTCQVESGYVCVGQSSRCYRVCGNGVINTQEACDDGNSVNGDGCNAVCMLEDGYTCVGAPSVCTQDCGNGSIQPGEACDDGNLVADDGCSAVCRVDPGYVCSGEPSVCVPSCGNGRLDPGEQCDDGGRVFGDGCSASCNVETGYVCSGEPSVCVLSCGDGALDPGEECDDGGNADGNGCSAICQVEPGYVCGGEPSICALVCGNASLDNGEACDDGNRIPGDGCSDTCAEETGYACVGVPSVCRSTCGDHVVASNEECDDGDTDAGDGCSDTCTLEDGWVCSGPVQTCALSCGNGVLDVGETCDDGDATSGDGCSSTCRVEPGYGCTGEPSDCVPICGDGVLTSTEQCDDGNLGVDDGCSGACELEDGYTCTGTPSVCTPVCGDGQVVTGEGCDDGNTVAGDGCSGACVVEDGWSCTGSPSVCQPGCGDGELTGPEACDDGNNTAGDGCSASCTVENGWTCTGEPSACSTTCGDGVLAGTETCDDGNTTANDGCSGQCAVENGWTCTGAPSTCQPVCGDGQLNGNESCDDGNRTSGDGCNVACRTEPGWECTGEPSECVELCGNGVRDLIEQCDDGNRTAGDGCSPGCKPEAGWVCDNGNPSRCTEVPEVDRDGDGVADDVDNCADVANPDQRDTNGNGVGDACDPEEDLADFEMSGGGGCGCSTSATPPVSSGLLLALAGLAFLWRRRQRHAAAVLTGLLLVGGWARAEEQTLSSQRWQSAMDSTGLSRTNSGALLGHLQLDVGLWGNYERDPLVLRKGAGISGPLSTAYSVLPYSNRGPLKQRAVGLIGDRVASELTLSVGILGWVQLFGALPVTLYQGHGGGVSRVASQLEPINQLNLGDVRLGAKVRLLRQDLQLVDLAFIPMVTLPVGLGARFLDVQRNADNLPQLRPDVGAGGWAQGYTSEGFPTLQPELALSRELLGFVAAGNVGLRLRRPYQLHGITVTHELLARAGVGFKGRKLAERVPLMRFFPVELGVEATAATPVNLPYAALPLVTPGQKEPRLVVPPLLQVYQHSMEVTATAGVDVLWLHPYVMASAGVLPGYGTPDFRVGGGIRLTTEFARPKPLPPPPPPAPSDLDHDGIPDRSDACPRDPEDVDGFEDEDGCPEADNDQDTILDVTDRCPLEPENFNGVEDEDGCPDDDVDPNRPALPSLAEPTDADGDGILDHQDNCPDAAEDLDAFQDLDGCPEADNDRDGHPDTHDTCALEAEVINGVLDDDGCPDKGRALVILRKERIEILDKVYFETNKDIIRPESFGLLKQVAAVLKANPNIKVRVEGHTDDRGDDAFNLDLSQRRAESVRAFLLMQGIAPERLQAQGYGETRPVADNRTIMGQDANRRVEFVVVEGAE
ncbi:MAG: DUF4215 domain-containing protein [Myxococcota bacterium]